MLHSALTILPDFGDDHALSSRNSTASFSTSASRSAAGGLCRSSSTGLENGLSTRIVPELGLLCLKWKIQLEENTTSHGTALSNKDKRHPECLKCEACKSGASHAHKLRGAAALRILWLSKLAREFG
jgi:hypothetical protein